MNNEQLARKYFSVFGNNPVSIDEWDILVQQMRVPLQEENDLLKSQLKKALEVIRFYAEGGHWGVQDTNSSVAIDPCDWCDNNGAETFRGGKRAREFLKKLEE